LVIERCLYYDARSEKHQITQSHLLHKHCTAIIDTCMTDRLTFVLSEHT